MSVFRVPVEWFVLSYIDIKADSVDEAVNQVQDLLSVVDLPGETGNLDMVFQHATDIAGGKGIKNLHVGNYLVPHYDVTLIGKTGQKTSGRVVKRDTKKVIEKLVKEAEEVEVKKASTPSLPKRRKVTTTDEAPKAESKAPAKRRSTKTTAKTEDEVETVNEPSDETATSTPAKKGRVRG